GLKVNVNFTGTAPHSMKELSGGQRTIVALSLVFAIQQCIPAPVYVLDETDAALDARYRANVAKSLYERAVNTQFLVTSFRGELCGVADRCWCVESGERESELKVVTGEQALEVIKNQEEEEEK
ncbi:hypothetical protein ADUPG1_008425, partial [Aduncisulcus paluster]